MKEYLVSIKTEIPNEINEINDYFLKHEILSLFLHSELDFLLQHLKKSGAQKLVKKAVCLATAERLLIQSRRDILQALLSSPNVKDVVLGNEIKAFPQ